MCGKMWIGGLQTPWTQKTLFYISYTQSEHGTTVFVQNMSLTCSNTPVVYFILIILPILIKKAVIALCVNGTDCCNQGRIFTI